MARRRRLAILGTRGIPANYGGFETLAEELAVRLAGRGHDVTVYGRRHYIPAGMTTYRGVRLVVLPTVRHKYLDTVVHTGVSTLHALLRRYDAVLYCNAANAVFTLWPRLFGTRVALNVDGIERKRQKWNRLGRLWYAMSERLAVRFPGAIVTDARVIERSFRALRRAVLLHPVQAPARSRGHHRDADPARARTRRYFLYVQPPRTGEQRARRD